MKKINKSNTVFWSILKINENVKNASFDYFLFSIVSIIEIFHSWNRYDERT